MSASAVAFRLAVAGLLFAVGPAVAQGGPPAQPAPGQMPMMGGQGQMPMMGGQGQMPMMGGQGQMPMMGGQGQMPMMGGQGQMPMMGGQDHMRMMMEHMRMMQGQAQDRGPAMRMMGQREGGMARLGRDGRRGWPIPAQRDLTVDDVRGDLQRHLDRLGNPHLKLGQVVEQGADRIVAEVVTQDNSLVQRVEVDRRSGRMRDLR